MRVVSFSEGNLDSLHPLLILIIFFFFILFFEKLDPFEIRSFLQGEIIELMEQLEAMEKASQGKVNCKNEMLRTQRTWEISNMCAGLVGSLSVLIFCLENDIFTLATNRVLQDKSEKSWNNNYQHQSNNAERKKNLQDLKEDLKNGN